VKVLDETTAVVDTVIIEPEERRLSLLARVQVVLDQDRCRWGES